MNALTCRVASTSLVQAIHKTTTARIVSQPRSKLILYQFIRIEEVTTGTVYERNSHLTRRSTSPTMALSRRQQDALVKVDCISRRCRRHHEFSPLTIPSCPSDCLVHIMRLVRRCECPFILRPHSHLASCRLSTQLSSLHAHACS
jgi:hypothetical protein